MKHLWPALLLAMALAGAPRDAAHAQSHVSADPPASDPSPASAAHHTADLLAGTAPRVPPGLAFSDDQLAGWQRDIGRIGSAWDERFGQPMRRWSAAWIGPYDGTVFYPFSGPDFLTLHGLFPHARRYVMVAMQVAGRPPDLQRSTAHTAQVLRVLRQATAGFAQLGFFVTRELYDQVQNDAAVEGITGMLLMAARWSGFNVLNVQPLRLTDEGTLETLDAATATTAQWTSVRITLQRPHDPTPVTLDYLRLNLGDAHLQRHPGHDAWIQAMTHHPTVFKAASHMPQTGWFGRLVGGVLQHAPLVIQDETGIPFPDLDARFYTALFGHYTGPNHLFEADAQRPMERAWVTRTDTQPLPFGFGYDKPAGSCLVLAVRPPGAP
jgi:hypothetical protein